ncbi:MAG: hypothetical protein IIA61_02085 [Candidatus Marinimicrobia bacterium]|nr:hypothetical protein [Candidatus Neomarinimicrobiota bacterium]
MRKSTFENFLMSRKRENLLIGSQVWVKKGVFPFVMGKGVLKPLKRFDMFISLKPTI